MSFSQTHALMYQLIEEKIAAMALPPRPSTGHKTGHKTKLPNARVKDGKLEVDPPRKKLPPHVKYAMDKRTKVKRGKRV